MNSGDLDENQSIQPTLSRRRTNRDTLTNYSSLQDLDDEDDDLSSLQSSNSHSLDIVEQVEIPSLKSSSNISIDELEGDEIPTLNINQSKNFIPQLSSSVDPTNKSPLLDQESAIPSLRKVPERYSRLTDLTLTEEQSLKGFPQFRDRSNPTIHDFSTGYHEMVPTNTMKTLQKLISKNPKESSFEVNFNNVSGLAKNGKLLVHKKVMQHILEVGRGLRSDTAQTILSSEEGLAAGHSGSNVYTKGQSRAHNLLRDNVASLIHTNPDSTEGMTPKSVACTLCSMAVSAYAPGEIAIEVKNSIKLKNQGAKSKWESNRNEAKKRVNHIYNSLSLKEKQFVDKYAKMYLDSTKPIAPKLRFLASDRPTTPLRKSTSPAPSSSKLKLPNIESVPIYSGQYLKNQEKASSPSLLPPENWRDYSYYVSAPLRAKRREVKTDELSFDEW